MRRCRHVGRRRAAWVSLAGSEPALQPVTLAPVQAAGPALEPHDSLVLLLQQDLPRAMFAAARHPTLAAMAGICQVGG